MKNIGSSFTLPNGSVLKNRIEQSNDENLEGIKICIELIEKYKSIDGVKGMVELNLLHYSLFQKLSILVFWRGLTNLQ